MSALKKTSVAIMIMFACLILAIVIGEARKDIYENPSAHQETVLSKLNELTTWGTINSTVEENMATVTSNDVETEENSGLSTGGIIILMIVIICVMKGLRNKN